MSLNYIVDLFVALIACVLIKMLKKKKKKLRLGNFFFIVLLFIILNNWANWYLFTWELL